MLDDSKQMPGDPSDQETVFSQDDWHPGEISTADAAPPPLRVGDVLFGAYEIEGMLGEGGMGAVYRARHISLDAPRAIKMMSASLISDPDAVERFHREARALLDVHHPAVCRCHDLLRDERGRIFLVMELIEGRSLASRLKERPLDEDELRALARRVASGLAAAHARGVVHRDVAPDNIVLPDGRVEHAKLVDFGVAKVLRVGEKTVTTGFKGKLAFASPEQLGFGDAEVGPASDFFSLGLVLCGAALGGRLDMGKSLAAAVNARQTPIEIPVAVPRALRKDIGRLLALDPAERPTSADDLFRSGDDSAPRSRQWLAVAAGLVLAVGAAILLGQTWREERPAGPDALPHVAAPIPAEETSIESADAAAADLPLGDPALGDGLLFESLRTRLLGVRGGSADFEAGLDASPNPVGATQSYHLSIRGSCACYPFVFFIDDERDRIELLYPNHLDALQPLRAGEDFVIPTSETLYAFETTHAGGGNHLKLLLLSEPIDFPDAETPELDPDSVEGLAELLARGTEEIQLWSATPEDGDNLRQLAALLDGLETMSWTTAETVLHINP